MSKDDDNQQPELNGYIYKWVVRSELTEDSSFVEYRSTPDRSNDGFICKVMRESEEPDAEYKCAFCHEIRDADTEYSCPKGEVIAKFDDGMEPSTSHDTLPEEHMEEDTDVPSDASAEYSES